MNPATSALVARIRTIRGHKVLLASDLAVLYGVQTKALIQAVKRNVERFPADFAFQLTEQGVRALRSQIVTLDEASLRVQCSTLASENSFTPRRDRSVL